MFPSHMWYSFGCVECTLAMPVNLIGAEGFQPQHSHSGALAGTISSLEVVCATREPGACMSHVCTCMQWASRYEPSGASKEAA